jgi:pimeloyl-ACP methyl ester carboxylesterase
MSSRLVTMGFCVAIFGVLAACGSRRGEPEIARVESNGVTLAYQSYGDEDDEAVLVIQGVGGRLASGADPIAEALESRGYRTILFDNRDTGWSTRLDNAGVPDFGAIQRSAAAGERPPVAYTLDDMAADAVGLLDALDIDRAHIVGGSSGGMIAQIVAAEYPERVASLTLVSSTTGNPELPKGELPEEATAMEPGVARQAAAAAVAGDLRARSSQITAPTVVVHGNRDTLFPIEHGKDVATAIPNAELRLVSGMGHEPDAAHVPAIVDAVAAVAEQAAH